MNLSKILIEDLKLNQDYFKVLCEDQAVCLIHSKWLHYLQAKCQIPKDFNQFGSLSYSSRQLINQTELPINFPWKSVVIQAIEKDEGKVNRLPKESVQVSNSAMDLNYFQLIHYVSETNYRNLWKQAWRNFHGPENSLTKSSDLQGYNDAVREILKRLFKCQIITIGDDNEAHQNSESNIKQASGPCHPNLVQMFCVVESQKFFYLIYERPRFNLRQCVMFSPAVLETSTVRLLFVVYQLLHALRDVHNHGLFLGTVTLSDIFLRENLWVQIFPQISKKLCLIKESEVTENMYKNKALDQKSAFQKNYCDGTMDCNVLTSLTESWVRGATSNFDYLLELNKLAGRVMCNPHCHPVLPWIMNFTVPEGGWRDLTKSKFRLSKGDKQLDLIYESATLAGNATTHGVSANVLQSSAISVPHHTSDVLTDITYYVYKARRLPKSILCQYVRQKWVPAEYPSTMQRLQEWTPDECIPEFFSDPTIFFSIHPDLPDLGVPTWCSGPEDFIKKHRAALESDHISERLNHWIDLTFGYRLSGNAAVKSKNVCLPLVDQHTSIRSHGMVKLFSYPHPHKMSNSLYFCSIAPKTFSSATPKTVKSVVSKLHDAKDSGEEETSSESSGKSSRWKVLRSKSVPAGAEAIRTETRPENQTIILPKDYSPLAALKQLESFYTFMARTQGGKLPREDGQIEKHVVSLHNQTRDMLVIGCIISEIALPSHLKSMPQKISLEERYSNALQLLKTYKHEIPRCLLQVLQLLLQLSPSFEPQCVAVKNKQASLPTRYSSVSSCGLPPPSPHQLLQPLIHLVPFPPYFYKMYSFLEELNSYSKQLEIVMVSDMDYASKQIEIEKIAKEKVSFTATKLQCLLPKLNTEAIDLLIPYLQEMFQNSQTSLLAAWNLFNLISQYLGPLRSSQNFLKLLIKIFDPDVPSLKLMKLYHRKFLLQLIVRLGLLSFLTHFVAILIEAVGGLKDFIPDLTDGNQDDCTSDTVSNRKGSHLEMPEHQNMGAKKRTIKTSMNDDEEDAFPDAEFEKEVDQFEFDDPIDEAEKMSNDTNVGLTSNFNYETQDNEKSDEEDCSDSINNIVVSLDVPDDDDPPNEEADADVIEALSPTTELGVQPKESILSKSAPIFDSHLSNYQRDSVTEKGDTGDYSGESSSVMLSPVFTRNENDSNISDIAAESVLWLAHRLGPVLTAKYLTRNLLRMLTLCYDGLEKREVIYKVPQCLSQTSNLSISCKWCSGDVYAEKVLNCLSRLSSLYGEQFIMLQYFPHIADLLILCKKRITATLESGFMGAMALLQHIIPYLSDATLMDHLQDVIIKDILNLVVHHISSTQLTFPGGSQSRSIITCRLIDIIHIIGLRIGFEMTREHLSNILQRFFSCFDNVYNPDGTLKSSIEDSSNVPLKDSALDEMIQTFTPEMAYLSYIPFCKLAGGIFIDRTMKNDELIRQLCLEHDLDMARSLSGDPADEQAQSSRGSSVSSLIGHKRAPSLGQEDSFVSGVFGKNVALSGNRIDVQLGAESHMVSTVGDTNTLSSNLSKTAEPPKYDITLLRRKMDNNQRHLKGNWLAYWEHEKGRSEKDTHFSFKQIKLQSFIGHVGAIRTIQILDNENSFLSSSKDKTVKLWALRSYGDGTAQTPCQWTYTQHRKSVFSVSFLDSLRLVGSCDSTVHIWDPFMGSCIKQIEPTKGSPITFLTSMPAPSTTFIAATTNSTIRFLDARTCRYMHEFKVSTGATGLIRCLAVSPNGHSVVVGHSKGMISVLDVRTGLLLGAFMGHEEEILQLKAFSNSYFVTSSLDHSISVWNYEDNHPKCHLRGPIEPVTSLCFYKGDVVSGTSGNKIGLHTSIDRKALYSCTRLRSDTFKGILTTMALLPLNKLLLLGAENGNIVLLS